MKRYQECNWIVKIFRMRFYLLVPFIFFWRSVFNPLKSYLDKIENDKLIQTDEYVILKGKELWKVLIGSAQFKMKYYYTSEEVFERIRSKFK
jgi:hypothetical protein